jgi:hypothetical protein
VRPATPVALVSAAALALGACAAPGQAGEIVVAPGAAARLATAWRFGYDGVAPPAGAATARVIRAGEPLPPGAGERARPGDVLLENGAVSFVIAAADGTSRGGALVDAWSAERPVDALGALRVLVGGQPLLARSVTLGVDAPTRAAWVDVVGEVAGDEGAVEVTTRYDVAPGVEGVLVHTSFVAPPWPLTDGAPDALAIADVVDEVPGRPSRALALAGPPAALVVTEGSIAHAVLSLDGPAVTVDPGRRSHGVTAQALGAAPGALVLHSRLFLVAPGAEPVTLEALEARALGAASSAGAPADLPAP